jgi:hypothetical protein
MNFLKLIATIGVLLAALNSCDSNYQGSSATSDTIVVKSDVALFYYPDSASMDTLKDELDEKTYQDAVSDYTHFMNIASQYMDSVKLKKITTTRGKILKFICKDRTEYVIDTKALVDFWGVILFNKHYKPKLIDMTIIDMEYDKYFY